MSRKKEKVCPCYENAMSHMGCGGRQLDRCGCKCHAKKEKKKKGPWVQVPHLPYGEGKPCK
ncbi:hypothetical protein LCGC14_1035890 [marine sediment metagenome]|uniref:Uncharacterized protein n=1 Tax=marine sediment metagenome TaxID=412755 RepID=A0A0F9MXV9_9ZZZZ